MLCSRSLKKKTVDDREDDELNLKMIERIILTIYNSVCGLMGSDICFQNGGYLASCNRAETSICEELKQGIDLHNGGLCYHGLPFGSKDAVWS